MREDGEDKEEDEYDGLYEFTSPAQLADDLVTLSLLPNSRWQNLLNLDIIKVRERVYCCCIFKSHNRIFTIQTVKKRFDIFKKMFFTRPV